MPFTIKELSACCSINPAYLCGPWSVICVPVCCFITSINWSIIGFASLYKRQQTVETFFLGPVDKWSSWLTLFSPSKCGCIRHNGVNDSSETLNRKWLHYIKQDNQSGQVAASWQIFPQ